MATTNKWKKYGIWLLSGLLTAMFLMAGGFKLAGAEAMVSNFDRFGYPLILMYITGFLEVVFAVGLWVPKIRGLAAIGLVCVMIGGVLTHIQAGEAVMMAPAAVLGVLSGILAKIRLSETKALYFQVFRSTSYAS